MSGQMAAARFVALGAAQYVIGVAAVAPLSPLATRIWKHPGPEPAGPPLVPRPGEQVRATGGTA